MLLFPFIASVRNGPPQSSELFFSSAYLYIWILKMFYKVGVYLFSEKPVAQLLTDSYS